MGGPGPSEGLAANGTEAASATADDGGACDEPAVESSETENVKNIVREGEDPLSSKETEATAEDSGGSSAEQVVPNSPSSPQDLFDDDEPEAWVAKEDDEGPRRLSLPEGRVLKKTLSAEEARENFSPTKVANIPKYEAIELELATMPSQLKTYDSCTLCKKPFEFLAHRKHCYSCGYKFCHVCANKQVIKLSYSTFPYNRPSMRPVCIVERCTHSLY